MEVIQLEIQGGTALCVQKTVIPAGLVGGTVRCRFDGQWNGLTPRLVVRCGDVQRWAAVSSGGIAVLPWECLISGEKLELGVDGWSEDGSLRIPTVWAKAGSVAPSAAEADPVSAEPAPTPGLVDQIAELARQAGDAARQLAEDADSGRFDGAPGQDYDHSEEFQRLSGEMAAYQQQVAADRASIHADAEAVRRIADGWQDENIPARVAGMENRVDTIDGVIIETVKPLQEQADDTQRSVNALWKLSKGQLWDIAQVTCGGHTQLPSGGEYGNVDEVYGKTTQDGTPSPDYPQEIKSVESIHILRTDADGSTLDERSITPPRSLNKVGSYTDKCDAVNGVWQFRTVSQSFGSSGWSDAKSGSNAYIRHNADGAEADAVGVCNYYTRSGSSFLTDKRFRIISDRVAIIDSDFTAASFSKFIAEHGNIRFVYGAATTTSPIDQADLEWLRNLTLLPGENLFVTDNHGRDVSYLMSDFINLGKVGG